MLRGAAATQQNERRIARAIENIEGIAAVYDEQDLDRMRASDKFNDLVVEPLEPYHLSTLTDGVLRGSHGGVAEARVPLVLSGVGVREGVELVNSSLADIAPTISELLAVDPPPTTADGHVLQSALTRP